MLYSLLICVFIAQAGYPQREMISLDGEWKFSVDKSSQATIDHWAENGIPNELAKIVTVPHTWNTDSGLENYYGNGWYEKLFTIPLSWKDKKVRISFDAVYHDAYIYLNGQQIASHLGSGYNRFFVDLSNKLLLNKPNRLVVCTDNSFSRNNIPFSNSFDWASDGGIIRSVSLIATGNPAIEYVHIKAVPDISNPDFINKGKVSLYVKMNTINVAPGTKAEFTITEENQPTHNIVYTGEEPVLSLLKENKPFSCEIIGIRAWRFDHPNLYKLNIVIKAANKVLDNYSTTFGFRDIRTNGTSILLNGEKVRLMGVEWMPGSDIKKGMAETHDELETMLKRLKSVNCIYTRFHWQQDDYVLDWCDYNGIMVQEELPYWGAATIVKDTLLELGKMQAQEMIRDHFNHPSIICWGIGNELQGHNPINIKGLSELKSYINNFDDSRLINYVSNTLQKRGSKDEIEADASSIGNLLNYNDYQEQWYQSDPVLLPILLDTIHTRYPDMPLIISEYGLCEPANRGGDIRRIKDFLFHQAIYDTKSYIAGAIYFCLNDYRTHMGETGVGKTRRRTHGVFDINGNARLSAEYLTELSSPIEPVGFWPNGDKIKIVLLGSLGLPSYSMKGYSYVFADPEIDYYNLQHMCFPNLLPGSKVELTVDNKFKDAGRLVVFNPAGYEVLNVKY